MLHKYRYNYGYIYEDTKRDGNTNPNFSKGALHTGVEIRGRGWIYSGTSDPNPDPRVPTLPINAQIHLSSHLNLTFFCLKFQFNSDQITFMRSVFASVFASTFVFASAN